MARIVYRHLSTFYTWALTRLEHMPANPCRDAWRPKRNEPRDRVLSDRELAALWQSAVEDGYPFGHLVQMLVLTAQRRGEVLDAVCDEFDFTALRTALADLAKAEADIILRAEEVTKASQTNRFQRLIAPVDGTIQQLEVHTIGGVVEAAKPLMVVVPAKGGIEVEVKVLNKDVGFVRVGQGVAVKLEAFPFTRFGTVPGKVRSISRDAVQDKDLGPVYIATILLERSYIETDGRRTALTPGLAATADIKTGTRRIISYLISPLQSTISQAGRER